MSVSNDIASCAVALGALAGQVNEEQWAVVRVVRQNLQAHAEQVQHMENGLCVMPDGTLHVGGGVGPESSSSLPRVATGGSK